MPTFLTSKEVAQQLRISGKNLTILARYRKNGLPCYRFGTYKSSRILYTQEDLDKWVSSQRVC